MKHLKHLKHILALILALALLGVPAFAAEPSGWATAELELREPTFSDDGGSFRCTAVIGEDVTLDGRLLCEKGTYRITVDLQNPYALEVVKE